MSNDDRIMEITFEIVCPWCGIKRPFLLPLRAMQRPLTVECVQYQDEGCGKLFAYQVVKFTPTVNTYRLYAGPFTDA